MKITPEMMMDAVAAQIEGIFPGEKIYRNLAPMNFERPSNMIEQTSIKLDPLGQGGGSVGLLYQYKITTFCVVDEVHDSHLPTLDLRAISVLAAFAQGYVKVGDRAPKVTACTADTSYNDCAEVMLTLSLNVDRSEFCPEAIQPLMESLDVNVRAFPTNGPV